MWNVSSTPKSTLWLLAALAGAGALMFLIRYKKGGQTFAVDAIEEIAITAQKVATAASDVIASLGDWTRKIPAALVPVFANAAALYSLPSGLLEAVAYRESRFRADIISGATISSAGAVGIMQIVPRWHPDIGDAGARDPLQAIPYAASYLRELFDRFGNWRLALAAYNWGPGNQEKDLVDGIIGNEWPAETRTYVAEISKNAGLA
jgi:soluble lytic murein transglycosylase-like protein